MKIPIRELIDGTRFELLRNGEKFKLVNREYLKNRTRIVCKSEKDGRILSLNHQCLVSPIIKPRIKLKFKG
jgi:hypothetical protein